MSWRDALRLHLLRRAPGARPGPPLGLPAAAPQLPEGARLLLLRPDHLGDLLFVGPALELLAERRPDLQTTLLVGSWSRAVAEGLPGGAAVECLEFPWFDRRPKGAPWRPYLRLRAAARQLAGRFDAAIVLRDDDWWSAWLTALAGIPLRAGHAHPGLRPFLSHELPESARPVHSAAANLALCAAWLGAPPGPFTPRDRPLRFRVTAADHARAAALLAEIGADAAGAGTGAGASVWAEAGPIAVHPGSGALVKRWRPEAWRDGLHALCRPGEPVVLTGGPDERALTAELAAGLERPVLDLAGRTDLAGLAAVYARCRLVMGPDSGPLHLAVAMGRPSLHLFGPASAERFGPWGPPERHRVVPTDMDCAPCGRLDWTELESHPCIRDIPVARLLAAARGLTGG